MILINLEANLVALDTSPLLQVESQVFINHMIHVETLFEVEDHLGPYIYIELQHCRQRVVEPHTQRQAINLELFGQDHGSTLQQLVDEYLCLNSYNSQIDQECKDSFEFIVKQLSEVAEGLLELTFGGLVLDPLGQVLLLVERLIIYLCILEVVVNSILVKHSAEDPLELLLGDDFVGLLLFLFLLKLHLDCISDISDGLLSGAKVVACHYLVGSHNVILQFFFGTSLAFYYYIMGFFDFLEEDLIELNITLINSVQYMFPYRLFVNHGLEAYFGSDTHHLIVEECLHH